MVGSRKLIGPFSQILTMRKLSLFGSLADEELEIIENGAVLVKDDILEDIGDFETLRKKYSRVQLEEISAPLTLLPGFIDAHTHICYAGSRSSDYALRIAGKSYLDIAKQGGGILSTVKATRKASQAELEMGLSERCKTLLENGITTCEVKSGYGLDVANELKMLQAIKVVNTKVPVDLISTCLAAHTLPPEFNSHAEYLKHIVRELLPLVKNKDLSQRVDIFVEESAFNEAEARSYVIAAKAMHFDLTVHADQFSTSGSKLAAEFRAASADHLEASTLREIEHLAKHRIPGVLLPGACMGLGINYPKARLMLDKGMCIAIASDWNPGSAPMGDLLMQAAVLSAKEKINTTETLSALTFRAAHALNIKSKGRLIEGMQADMIAYPTSDHRDILYHQGSMKPSLAWIKGNKTRMF